MNKRTIFIAVLLLVVLAPVVSAQTNSVSDSAKTRIQMERKIIREDYRKILKEKREATQNEIKTKRAEFKAKLGELKDERKKATVERIDLKLSTINQNTTQRLSLSIDKLEKLLDKFKERAQKAQAEGKNTTEVNAAITEAEASIASAKEDVAAQAAKGYTAQITDESGLKNKVGSAVSSLRKDLKITHDTVKNAKQKVMDVARALAKLYSDNPSATVTPSI